MHTVEPSPRNPIRLPWLWAFPQLYAQLAIPETRVAHLSGCARSRLLRLRGQADASIQTVVQIYRALYALHPTLTLHHLIVIDGVGQPPIQQREPLLGNVPTRGFTDVWWNTHWLRLEIARRQHVPRMTLHTLALAAGISQTNLVKLERGMVQGRVVSLLALYAAGRHFIPELTLHDVLIIATPPDTVTP